MKKIISSLIIGSAFVAVSCTPKTNPHFKVGKPYTIEGQQYSPAINPKYAEIGMASWYGNGDGFHNKLTANGELFDKGDLTAAHKTLPLPSIVTVTNLENGNSLKLRVNDRGPFVKGRIIDVSEKAAKKLGFHSKGMAKVLVELDREGSLKALEKISATPEQYAKIKAAYGEETPEMKIVEEVVVASVPVEEVTSSNIIDEPNSQNSYNSKIVEKIVIREEIVKPAETKTTTIVKSEKVDFTTPRSMVGYKPKLVRSTEVVSTKTAVEPVKVFDEGALYVQVASLNSLAKASEVSAKVSKFAENKIFDADINGKSYYRVRLGGFGNMSAAKEALNNIKQNGFVDAYIVSEKN